ncbi:MAG: three-Cys-motif partner protein TcmP [Candidatus Methanofastidiosia archaeon]|jgi:three-Cys-motif partner protein
MPRRSRDIEDLDKRLEILQWDKHNGLLDEVAQAGEYIYNEFKQWTPLKLMGLSYFAGGYAQILGNLKKKHQNLHLVYIDPFSGCGINKIDSQDNQDVLIAGSPLTCIDSVTNREVEFDCMFFNDADPEFSSSLEKRLEFLSDVDPFCWIADSYCVYNKDCNDALKDIVHYLNEKGFINYLAFLDPYKWEISWSMMEELLSIEYGDIIMTFQARLVAKEIGKYLSQRIPSLGDNIRRFLGEENENVIEKLGNEKAVRKYYLEKIKEYRKFVLDIKIKSGKRKPYSYYLVFASRKKNPRWKRYIVEMRRLVESFSGDLVGSSFDYQMGRTQRLLK